MAYKDIFKAICADDIEAVKTFLPKHANDIDKGGNSALIYTIHFAESKQIFDLLLANGADPYTGSNIHSVLYWLWGHNWPDKIQTLVDHGVDLNSIKHKKRSKHAIITDVCRALSDPYSRNYKFDITFLKGILRCGARTDIPDEKGKLPLDYLPEGVRTEIDTYIANLEAERMGNTAHETEFAYGV